MFNNVGEKIKIVAKVCLGISIFLAFAAFIGFLCVAVATGEPWFIVSAFVSPLVICLLGVVESWFIYAFGNITSHVCKEKVAESEEEIVSFDSFD